MIRAVLFDFGGVISSSPFEAFNRYEDELGIPPDTIRNLNAIAPDTNAWARLERGESSVEAFGVAFEREARDTGFDLDADRVPELLRGELRPVEAVRYCSERLRTGLLTNDFQLPGKDPDPGHLEVLELFDVVVESSLMGGVRKPDPELYRIACRQLEVDPAECVFLDDLGVNLKPARAMGMKTIEVEDPERAVAELHAALGSEPGGGRSGLTR